MNIFLITFEIFPPSLLVQNEIIENAIKMFEFWARPTSTVWLIKTHNTKEVVINHLRAYAGPTDRILVMRVNSEWISINLPVEVINWLKAN